MRRRPPFRFRLQPEDWNTRLSRRLGLARKFRSGDPDFDSRFFISTSDPLRCAVFLADPRNRAALERLDRSGWQAGFERRQLYLKKNLTPHQKINLLSRTGFRVLTREIFGFSNLTATFSDTEVLQFMEELERLVHN